MTWREMLKKVSDPENDELLIISREFMLSLLTDLEVATARVSHLEEVLLDAEMTSRGAIDDAIATALRHALHRGAR